MNSCRCPQELDLADPIGGPFRYDCLICNPDYPQQRLAFYQRELVRNRLAIRALYKEYAEQLGFECPDCHDPLEPCEIDDPFSGSTQKLHICINPECPGHSRRRNQRMGS